MRVFDSNSFDDEANVYISKNEKEVTNDFESRVYTSSNEEDQEKEKNEFEKNVSKKNIVSDFDEKKNEQRI